MTQAYNLSQLANNLNNIGQLDATDGLVNAVPATNGGTGQAAYAVGDLLYANTTTALSKLADVGTGNALISGGVGIAPLYGKIGLSTHVSGALNLTSQVSGTLPVANGGTGAATLPANNVLLGSGTSALQAVAPSTSGNVLTSTGTAWVSSAPASSAPTTAQVLTATAGATAGAVGTYALMFDTTNVTRAPGSTVAGSSLRYAGVDWLGAQSRNSGTAPAGTWRVMGYNEARGSAYVGCTYIEYGAAITLYLRIS